MNYEPRTTNSKGFSLTEVLLAVGILAVGMLFIAGTFLVGIHFSTIATEQTIAAVASDEAFAKIKIYGVNVDGLFTNQQTPFTGIDPNEFAYPSTRDVAEKQYYWSALCGRTQDGLVQVTVFVSRKAGSGTKYRNPADPCNPNPAVAINYPMPVPVGVYGAVGNNVLNIRNSENWSWINDGYTIVDNQTGQIYRVVKRRGPPDENVIELDRNWAGPSAPSAVWVVPPPFGSGRHPCIAVYQTEIRF